LELGLRPKKSWSWRGLRKNGSYEDNPSRSYCRAHSAGKSRKVATPIPRGNRPSTAACTSEGARKARLIVRLTCLIIAIPAAAGVLAHWGLVLGPAVGAALMSASTVICAVNARMLRLT
jgi:hypothetical protein